MGRTQAADVDRLVDPLLSYNFDFIIPFIPGSNADLGEFKTKIQTTSIPGRVIETLPVELKGVTKEFAGRVQYTRTLPFEMIELRNMASRRALDAWSRYTRNDSGQGAYATEYMVPAELHLFDDKDKVVEIIDLNQCWLESYDDSSLDGAGTTAVTITGSLKYFTHQSRIVTL